MHINVEFRIQIRKLMQNSAYASANLHLMKVRIHIRMYELTLVVRIISLREV